MAEDAGSHEATEKRRTSFDFSFVSVAPLLRVDPFPPSCSATLIATRTKSRWQRKRVHTEQRRHGEHHRFSVRLRCSAAPCRSVPSVVLRDSQRVSRPGVPPAHRPRSNGDGGGTGSHGATETRRTSFDFSFVFVAPLLRVDPFPPSFSATLSACPGLAFRRLIAPAVTEMAEERVHTEQRRNGEHDSIFRSSPLLRCSV
jgi:hypothetical protein